jgi:recombinational DNA repair protein RecT
MGGMMVGQSSFKVETRVIRKDENQKWKKLKRELEVIFDKFEEGTIVNKISNKVMIKKILKRMDQLEIDEEGGLI